MKKLNFRLIIEPLIWIAFTVFPLILFPTLKPFVDKGLVNPAVEGLVILHSLLIAFYYFNYYIALPRYYFTRKYSTYFPLLALCLAVLLVIMFTDPSYNPLPSPPFVYAKTAFAISVVLRFFMVMLLSLGVASYGRLKQTEQEKLNAEINALKTQINPHFLFNTLNSVYALTVTKSDLAPEAITRLSAIMRYAITDAASSTVPLEKEINYVSAYIELEKLRITKKVQLQYTINGEATGKTISPMLFIPLIENAFKYGVSTNTDSVIHIAFDIRGNSVSLFAKNTKAQPDRKHSNGLGLHNVKKRLALTYPGQHTLEITDGEKEFSVTLVLQLHD